MFASPNISQSRNCSNGSSIPFRLFTKDRGYKAINWLVGCFGLYGPLRQYFSLYRAVSQREVERKEKW